jgi:FeS assembly protein IscX
LHYLLEKNIINVEVEVKWTDIEDIVELLEEKFPRGDLVGLRFTSLHNWVMELDEFDDISEQCNEKILEAIQAEWIELREEKIG